MGVQLGRYRADDRPSDSVDAHSAASRSASQAQDRGFTFGRLLNKPAMPLQLSRQRTESDEAETATSAGNLSGELFSVSMWKHAQYLGNMCNCEEPCHDLL